MESGTRTFKWEETLLDAYESRSKACPRIFTSSSMRPNLLPHQTLAPFSLCRRLPMSRAQNSTHCSAAQTQALSRTETIMPRPHITNARGASNQPIARRCVCHLVYILRDTSEFTAGTFSVPTTINVSVDYDLASLPSNRLLLHYRDLLSSPAPQASTTRRFQSSTAIVIEFDVEESFGEPLCSPATFKPTNLIDVAISILFPGRLCSQHHFPPLAHHDQL